jgi:PIN domain nuclease of toxin-antitoxin system
VTRLLLDTRLVLWWLNGDARLPQPVLERVLAPEAEVFVS